MPPYQPRLDPDRRERVVANMTRVFDFWKALDHRIARDIVHVKHPLEKRDVSYHWLEMGCRFTSMELAEVRHEISESYGHGTPDSALQPLDRNTAQAILAAKNLFASASTGTGRMGCPQFEENITFDALRNQLQETLVAINRQVQIYMEANPKTAAPAQ